MNNDLKQLTVTIEGKRGAGKTIVAEYLATMLGAAGFGDVKIKDKKGPDEGPKAHLICCVKNRSVVIRTKTPPKRGK